MAHSPLEAGLGVDESISLGTSPAKVAKTVFEHFDQHPASRVRVGRGPSGNEGIVGDHRYLMAHIPVVLAVGPNRVTQDVLQWVRRRSHVEVGADKTGSVVVVVFDGMPRNVAAPYDALTVAFVTRECEAGDAVAFSRHRPVEAVEDEYQLVQPVIIDHVDDRAAASHDQDRVVLALDLGADLV